MIAMICLFLIMQPLVVTFEGIHGGLSIYYHAKISTVIKEIIIMNLAQRIQILRKQKGLSQEDLAHELGVSRQAVSKWESEQASPDLDKIILLSQFFNVSTDYLLKGIESSSSPIKTDPLKILSVLPTALNALGLIITVLLWTHYQTNLCYIPVFVCNIGSLIIYTVGLSVCSASEINQVKKKFWGTNIWLMAFIPVSLLMGKGLFFISYPIVWLSTLILYILICLGVSFFIK